MKRLCYWACFGGIFALPGIIPRIGTVAQFVSGFATTFPETDLARHQMWCLYVELSHVHGCPLGTRDLAFHRDQWHSFQSVNQGEEAFKQTAIRQMRRWISKPHIRENLQEVLLCLVLPETTISVMSKSVKRGAPYVLGLAIGVATNVRRVHRFLQSTLSFWNESEPSDSIALWDKEAADEQTAGAT